MKKLILTPERATLKEDFIIFDGKIYFILSEKKLDFKHYGDEILKYICFGNKHVCEFEFLYKIPLKIYSYSYIDDNKIKQVSFFDSYNLYNGS